MAVFNSSADKVEQPTVWGVRYVDAPEGGACNVLLDDIGWRAGAGDLPPGPQINARLPLAIAAKLRTGMRCRVSVVLIPIRGDGERLGENLVVPL